MFDVEADVPTPELAEEVADDKRHVLATTKMPVSLAKLIGVDENIEAAKESPADHFVRVDSGARELA